MRTNREHPPLPALIRPATAVALWGSTQPSGSYKLIFQAEDGIRDDLVTGVQTCALPIYQARGLRLKNRIVVSPMAMYSCTDGVPGDFHLVHLGARAMGGAGLVMVEMTCTSPDARITPGCPGLWNDEQAQAFARIVDFVHAQGGAHIGVQLGRSESV